MFPVNKHRPIVSDLAIITDNYLELLADENPILYTGTNDYGNRILGVIVEESEEDYTVRYFHVIINDSSYNDFVNRRKSLLEIIQSSNVIFVVDKKGGEIVSNNLISFEDIPTDYLPLPNSYCPEGYFMPSLNFAVSLQGKKADLHIVDVNEGSSIQQSFSDVLKQAINSISDLGLTPKLYLEPSRTGSFRVNYKIEFENNNLSLFTIDKEKIADYLNSYLGYIMSKLPNEQEDVFKEADFNITSEALNELAIKYNDLYNLSHISFTSSGMHETLIDNINDAAHKFQDITNQISNSSSFNKIELINYQSESHELGLGTIDESFYASIETKLIEPVEIAKIEVKVKETTPKTYRIRVFVFNTESGHCKAYFYPNLESEENYKVQIVINKGDKEYGNSIIAKSIGEDKVVSILGVSTTINGHIVSIEVDL